MLKKYTPPYISLLLIVNMMNIIFSTYFVAFLLAGVVFKVFIDSLKKEYNYIFILSILTFLIIENTQGIKLFSLTIISFIVYYFIIPRIKHLFSSSIMSDLIFVFSFYLLFYILVQAYVEFDISILLTFLVNFIIDILIIGFIL